MDDLRTFFQALLTRKPIGSWDTMKQNFLDWLSNQTKKTPEEIGQTWGQALTGLFENMEDLYGRVT